MNFYNDNDPKTCAWLRELIAAGELPAGHIDNRSILDVKPEDLAMYDQCHFFAGIGGWPLALRWAGLEGVPGIWTGSCPCQPLSCAGKRQGHEDERHLWPAFWQLIAECRPSVCFGEQVASRDGREWLSGVRLDLEQLGYRVGAADLCAAGVGAPHRRQRLYWVADSKGERLEGRGEREQGEHTEAMRLLPAGSSESGVMADTSSSRRQLLKTVAGEHEPLDDEAEQVADARGDCNYSTGWSRFDLIPCRDGKARRAPAWSLKPIFQLLADGVWCSMVPGWSESVEGIQERTMNHATETRSGAGEVLRALRQATEQEAIRERAGGHDAIQGATILLFALLQLEGQMGQVIERDAPGVGQDGGDDVPALRGASEGVARPPQERRLDGQPAGELHDLVSALSQELAQRHEDAAQVAVACMGSPLVGKIPGRMGLLRGYGNAIVPQVAQAFIEAWKDVREPLGEKSFSLEVIWAR